MCQGDEIPGMESVPQSLDSWLRRSPTTSPRVCRRVPVSPADREPARAGHRPRRAADRLDHLRLAHLPDVRYVLLATLAGVPYGWLYLATRRITASAVTHALVDWIWV